MTSFKDFKILDWIFFSLPIFLGLLGIIFQFTIPDSYEGASLFGGLSIVLTFLIYGIFALLNGKMRTASWVNIISIVVSVFSAIPT